MQSYDKYENVVNSGLMEKLEDLETKMGNPDVAHVTVGRLPHKGDEVMINGLRFKAVTGKNQIKKDKRLILELL